MEASMWTAIIGVGGTVAVAAMNALVTSRYKLNRDRLADLTTEINLAYSRVERLKRENTALKVKLIKAHQCLVNFHRVQEKLLNEWTFEGVPQGKTTKAFIWQSLGLTTSDLPNASTARKAINELMADLGPLQSEVASEKRGS